MRARTRAHTHIHKSRHTNIKCNYFLKTEVKSQGIQGKIQRILEGCGGGSVAKTLMALAVGLGLVLNIYMEALVPDSKLYRHQAYMWFTVQFSTTVHETKFSETPYESIITHNKTSVLGLNINSPM